MLTLNVKSLVMASDDGDPTADRSSPSPPPPVVGTILNMVQPQQPYEVEDDHSGSGVLRDYNGVFEGPEKTLGKRPGAPSFDFSNEM